MVKRTLLLSLVVLTFFAVAQAAPPTILCQEGTNLGCIVQLPVGGTTTAWVASAGSGQTFFSPWGSPSSADDWIALNPG